MSVSAINTISQVSQSLGTSAQGPVNIPTQQQLDKFNQVMFNTGNKTPEQGVVDSLQQANNQMAQQVAMTQAANAQGMSPDGLLASQAKLTRAVVAVSLGGKVAGQLSTTVNKLVSMS